MREALPALMAGFVCFAMAIGLIVTFVIVNASTVGLTMPVFIICLCGVFCFYCAGQTLGNR